MLSLNSYGCVGRGATAAPPLSTNQHLHGHVVLPRLSLHGGSGSALSPTPPPPRGVTSLTKLEMMRASTHPLYRTTAGFDYGRHLDFKDVALSCPKHAKQATFTKEFIAGTFTDTSLSSADKSKQRHECWQKKVVERTKHMQVKYEELQQVLEAKKSVRRRAREQRRREMDEQHRAAAAIQARMRGVQVRQKLRDERHRRRTAAALRIQQVCRSRAEMHRAQQLLADMKHQVLGVFAIRIQGAARSYLLRADAKRELERRRQRRAKEAEDMRRRVFEMQDDAARDIQRALRSHIARKLERQQSTTSSSSDKDDFKDYYYATRGARSRRTLASLRRAKREKSIARIPLASLKA
ncbi:hypothetical protein PybrP1_003676 [[Pythium] brassicae (nom. inval.)]|nr:hypothetical protein PybrP1_003676 [[Pythium] brassicae (nom. inval.)]